MKKIISLFISIIFVLFTFSSCNEPAPQIDYSDNYVEGQDAQESNIGYTMMGSFPETDDSFYVTLLNTFYVADKHSHKIIPLCSKPDCKHDKYSSDCEAHGIGSAQLYMNKLYYLHEDYKKDENGIDYFVHQLCCMELDGTDKKVVFETKKDTFMISSYKIHRGYFYMMIANQSEDGSYSSTNGELCRMKIGESEPETIFDMPHGESVIDVRFHGNNMYMLYETPMENVSEDNFTAHFVCYDLDTMEHEDMNEKLDYPISGLFTISDEKIVYSDVNDQSKICVCSLDGSDNRIAVDLSDTFGEGAYDYYNVMSSNDDDIMILASNEDDYYHKTLILGDKAFQHFESCDLPEAAQPNMICSGDLMLFIGQGGDGENYENNSTLQLWLADKTKMGQDGWVEMVCEVEF